MTVELNSPLMAKQQLSAQEQELLADLQGNILKPHGRDHALHVFLSFSDAAGARQFLRELSWLVTSATDQFRDTLRFRGSSRRFSGRLFISVLLSASGYRAIRVFGKAPTENWFTEGMKTRGPIELRDVSVDQWQPEYKGEYEGDDLHALVILAGDSAKIVSAYGGLLKDSLPKGVNWKHAELGKVIRNKAGLPTEHFGFVDGISSPEFFRDDGLLRDDSREPAHWNAEAGLGIVLTPDPGGANATSFGSFLVFRKLQQNVQEFQRQERAFARTRSATSTEDDAAALWVGRRKDGTPLITSSTLNDFNYQDDLDGKTCPFASHIRRMNPRGSTDPSNRLEAVKSEMRHTVVRRSMMYSDSRNSPESVGVLFMCYQSNIREQFEHLQRDWANSMFFRTASGAKVVGIDSLIGVRQENQPEPSWLTPDGKNVPFLMKNCVDLRGGEYFFAPSISFLRTL